MSHSNACGTICRPRYGRDILRHFPSRLHARQRPERLSRAPGQRCTLQPVPMHMYQCALKRRSIISWLCRAGRMRLVGVGMVCLLRRKRLVSLCGTSLCRSHRKVLPSPTSPTLTTEWYRHSRHTVLPCTYICILCRLLGFIPPCGAHVKERARHACGVRCMLRSDRVEKLSRRVLLGPRQET